MSSKKSSRRTSRQSHRSTLSLSRTEIVINVYDLLPPGRLSSVLWTIGASLLHSGVVINGKEYAYGGHDQRGVTGVYWTRPKSEPPGGSFRIELLQGFTFATQAEIDTIIRHASDEFEGTAYNLLTQNCNHFTSYLCQKLTGRPGPGWLNRAANIGVALPCVVPRHWMEPPDFETADGELLRDDYDDDGFDAHERTRMLRPENTRRLATVDSDEEGEGASGWNSEETYEPGRNNKGKGPARDSSGRTLPPAERAPSMRPSLPRRTLVAASRPGPNPRRTTSIAVMFLCQLPWCSLSMTKEVSCLPPGAFLGTPPSTAYSYGRSPAYRRLPYSLETSRPTSGRVAPFSVLRPPQPPALYMRSPFLPETIAAVQSRSLHQAARWFQRSAPPPKTDAKPGQPKDTSEKAASGAESEAKAESGEQAKEEGEHGKKEEKKEEKKEDLPPPPPHGDKTPWQVFMETMQTEFKASKEWNESTKQLADSAHSFTESESVRRARQAYENTTGAVSSTAGRVLKSSATAVGKGAAWTWETPVMKGVRKGANLTGDIIDKATKPLRETEAYKNVKDVIDDGSSSRYGGWVEKEERRKARELREKQARSIHGKTEDMVEDPNAGTNITLHKDAAWKEAWRDFRDKNKLVQGLFSMKSVYQESENPLISTARSITDRVAGFFAENETAMVIRKFREMDPNFQIEPFLQDMREYILPEVLDAYVKGDTETLRVWLSAAQYSVYEALTKQYLQAGLKSDGRILDIRHVDILKARMLEPGDIPVFIITCRTQEVHVYRNAKTNELAAGMEDKVQLVTYAIGITRTAEDVNNPETSGWRLIEMQKSNRDYY
ncbi:DUF862-domain-containing protein [Durotheca rogersii]|uniref:DUF862-domain-containing protein n=1 Tax=Durotheca rogersii TaxID=419775 RepID=UPI0022203345|nr:DUF862-domain-containing protein [Durotheca rogersii]KAI5868252.1 DUF862-domain-containing protein [Durotheca rogersii]